MARATRTASPAAGASTTGPTTPAADSLTARQRRFVAEYGVDGNATQAAIRAGYAAKNADVTGPRLLGNVGVAAAIAAEEAARRDATKVTRDRVLAEIAACAFVDPLDLFEKAEPGGLALRTPEQWPEATRRAVASVKVRRRYFGAHLERYPVEIIEVKFWPKLQAVEQYGKHLGLFKGEADAGETLAELFRHLAERRLPPAKPLELPEP